MSRGQDLAEGLTIDSGVSENGLRTIIHFQGETVTFHQTQDMEPILEHVKQMRERNEGKGWGEGREIGHVPELFYRKISAIRDIGDRKKTLRAFFKENPAFCAYAPYLKD